jgi:hypothetical protein
VVQVADGDKSSFLPECRCVHSGGIGASKLDGQVGGRFAKATRKDGIDLGEVMAAILEFLCPNLASKNKKNKTSLLHTALSWSVSADSAEQQAPCDTVLFPKQFQAGSRLLLYASKDCLECSGQLVALMNTQVLNAASF